MQEPQEMQVWALSLEDPLEESTVTPLLPGESYGQRSLAGYSPYGHKELGTTNNNHELEEGNIGLE